MANVAILDGDSICQAVYRRLDAGRNFAGREAYIGASEEGRCSRRVVYDKVIYQPDSERFSPASAHKVNLGRVLENEAVQLLRLSGMVDLRETGQNQVEVIHPDMAYFRCHPDGRVLAGDLVLGDDAVSIAEGDGALEVKSTADYLLKMWIKDGLGLDYRSQANNQMGLRGLSWGLFVATCRESVKTSNLPPIGHGWILRFDPAMWEESQARVRRMEFARLACVGSIANPGDALPIFDHALLPEGEPDRGYCASCPLAPTCSAYLNSAPELPAGMDLSPEVKLELEVILEELGSIEGEWKPLEKRIKDLKEQAKPLVPMNLKRKFVLDTGEVQVGKKEVSDFNAERLVNTIQEAVASTELPDESKDLLSLSILKAFQAESARKKDQPTLTLKPRRSA